MKRGYLQCLTEMMAADTFNERKGTASVTMYGVVTIGDKWKFQELEGTTARIDAADYYIKDLEKIMGILLHITADNATEPV